MIRELGKVFEVNAKTGLTKTYEKEFDLPEEPMEDLPKGIDAEKLKQVLLKAGIIKDISEVE